MICRSLVIISVFCFYGCSLGTNPNDQYREFGEDLNLSDYGNNKVKIQGNVSKNSFFPMAMGLEWTYKLVYSSNTNGQEDDSLSQIRVKITEKREIEGKIYFVFDSYFLPGPQLPKPAFIRKEGENVYTYIGGEEYILYSFSSNKNAWIIPLFVNHNDTNDFNIERTVNTDNTAAFALNDLYYFPSDSAITGRSEHGWGEIIEKGLGRARIESYSMIYGKRVWNLVNLKITN
ncbi:MAG: hypothetical protein GF372_10025 [Candidatus Marinimicrobia bacterium]|nr:hypothetical protein [Candidatus Neomarinimicrobiota bacterium]